jgi:O-antigen/teichoic acid export membrane protein
LRIIRAQAPMLKNLLSQPKMRVVAGVVAHFYAQGVTILTQLVTLPIFLARWSPEQYGQWLVLSAIPIYLTVADFGIVTAGGNLMSMHRARGEMEEVNRVFHSSILIIIVMVPLLALCAVIPLSLYGFGLQPDQRTALAFLAISALLNVGCGLFDSAYRPFGKYPKVTLLLTTARLVDWGGSIIGLYLGGSLTSVAIGLLCGRTLSCIILYLFAQRDVPELRWNLDHVDAKLVKQLIRSGVGFLSFPVGNMLTLQGMVVLVGAQLGGGAVALFNTSRTLARLLAQLAILTGKSMAPEMSRLYGAGKIHEGDVLIRQLLWTIIPVTLVGAVVLELLGPVIIEHWSHGKLVFDRTVFTWLLAGAVCAAFWQIQSTKLTATNRHSRLATMFLLVSTTALLVAFLTEKVFGIAAAGAATCLVEVLMALCTIWTLAHMKKRAEER